MAEIANFNKRISNIASSIYKLHIAVDIYIYIYIYIHTDQKTFT